MDIWPKFDKYTPYFYRQFLKRLHSGNRYSGLISSYAEEKITDPPKPLSKRDISRTELSRQNVRFIENARETYETGLRVSSHVRPLLFHYSWHSFLAFLMHTIMRFDGRAKGHGITVSMMERNEIKLEFHPFKKRGFFQRVLDTLTILGYPSAFARWIPIVEKNSNLIFVENTLSPFANIKRMDLKDIITFDERNYLEKLYAQELAIKNIHKYELMEKYVRRFLVLFTASTITRYRPQVWSDILAGEGEYESSILTEVRGAYDTYLDFVNHIHYVLESISR